MTKLKLDQFLRASNIALSSKVRLLLSDSIEPVDLNGNGLSLFLNELYDHTGMFEIDGIQYDSVIFTGSDNIYFSYAFNPNNCKAVAESLFILSSLQISKTSDNTYELVEATGQISSLILRT